VVVLTTIHIVVFTKNLLLIITTCLDEDTLFSPNGGTIGIHIYYMYLGMYVLHIMKASNVWHQVFRPHKG